MTYAIYLIMIIILIFWKCWWFSSYSIAGDGFWRVPIVQWKIENVLTASKLIPVQTVAVILAEVATEILIFNIRVLFSTTIAISRSDIVSISIIIPSIPADIVSFLIFALPTSDIEVLLIARWIYFKEVFVQ